jgi:hypothetical protein
MRHRSLAVLLLVLATACAGVQELQAARFVAGLTPIRVTGRGGQVITQQYQLTLGSEEKPTRFKLKVEDWWRSEDGQQSYYVLPGTLKHSCGTWVTVNPAEALVQPGATLTARISIAIPSLVPAGGYWCVLTVDETPNPLDIPSGIGAQFVASVSTGIFVNIEPVERAVEFVEIAVDDSRALVKLRNLGNGPLVVEGRFEFLRSTSRQPVAVVPLTRVTLLPEPVDTAILTTGLPDAALLPSGTYVVRVVIDVGLDRYLGAEREIELKRPVTPLQQGP